MESVSIKQESDMRLLDFRVRISLAILLDENDNWRQLCRLMNLGSLESGFATFSSPTKEVLAMFEVSPIPRFHSSQHSRCGGHVMLVCMIFTCSGLIKIRDVHGNNSNYEEDFIVLNGQRIKFCH